jgi:hypothetical protein
MSGDIARYCPPDIRMKILATANGARQRARTRGLAVDEDLCAFALELYSAQGGCCALSGLPFNLRVVGGGKARRPYAPSLDRVDAASGYTRDNVRLVCQAVNFALNAYGEDVFREIALATARFVPERIEPLAATKPSRDEERDRKRAYIDHVIKEAPRILAAHDGRLDKDAMRRALRSGFVGALPSDEANAYGWGFRRLTEAGVIEPASKTDFYALAGTLGDARGLT